MEQIGKEPLVEGRTIMDVVRRRTKRKKFEVLRGHVDRPFLHGINDVYQGAFDLGRTPLQAALDTMRATGRVALFDVGCGTGNSVRMWAEAVAARTRQPRENIRAVGITIEDFSQESMYARTLQAHQNGSIEYVIGDAGHMPEIPTDSMDVTLSHEVLIHSQEPEKLAQEMLRVTAPGGSIFFDVDESQNTSDAPIMNLLDVWTDEYGYQVDISPTIIRHTNNRQTMEAVRACCRVVIPPNKYTPQPPPRPAYIDPAIFRK